MLSPSSFIDFLKNQGINFYTGIPDSILKDVCAYIACNTAGRNHIIAANEGNAVAIASGYNLATGRIPAVYMQNSGLGNAVNPLISLADKHVYSIPMFLLIGWRGEPGIKDEPQHKRQGEITEGILKVMKIPYVILDSDKRNAEEQVLKIINKIKRNNSPGALIIRKGIFHVYNTEEGNLQKFEMTREDALKVIIKNLSGREIIVSTTGMTSRELYELREASGEGHERDFLTIGSMGHASSIALGIALQKTNRQVIVIDGDGSALMHMGAIAVNGTKNPGNLKHIIINNGCHESVGGQPTAGFDISFPAIACACGYREAVMVKNKKGLASAVKKMIRSKHTVMLEIRVRKGSRRNLGRPGTTAVENKLNFMEYIKGGRPQ